MVKKVYLSSTLSDLRLLRDEAKNTLTMMKFEVMDSYAVSPKPPVDKCLEDVSKADIYLGLFAGHYGFSPDGYGGQSITELEYRKAITLGKPCYIFIRDFGSIPPADNDGAMGRADDYTRLRALLEHLRASHVVKDFTDANDLGKKIALDLADIAKEVPPPTPPLMADSSFSAHRNQLDIGLLVVGIRGIGDDAVARLCTALPADWQANSVLFAPEPGRAGPDRLAVDRSLARTRCAALLLSPPALARLTENPVAGEALVRMFTARLGAYTLLLDGVQPSDLPAGWPPAASSFQVDAWLAGGGTTQGGQLADLVQRFPGAAPGNQDVTNSRLVGLAYSVLAMTRDEARALADKPTLVQDELGRPSYEFFKSLLDGLVSKGDWVNRYGPCRHDWQPFGNGSVKELLQDVVNKINEQPQIQRRDREALRGNRIRLHYYPFEPAAFQRNAPDWPLLEAMRGRGCLVLVDELSALHPALCRKGEAFLSDPTVTVATLSGLDPAVLSLDALIDNPQKIEDLVRRFAEKLDLRCELGINNKARALRWLRQSLPETLTEQEALGADPDRLQEFRTSLAGGL